MCAEPEFSSEQLSGWFANRWAGPAGRGRPLPENALTTDDVAAAVLLIVNQVCIPPSPQLHASERGTWLLILMFLTLSDRSYISLLIKAIISRVLRM
jgi:hypothetical protein